VPVSDLIEPERHVVRATEDQEAVARQFERYNLVAAPVVDAHDRMVG
jgi:magnesium transporter